MEATGRGKVSFCGYLLCQFRTSRNCTSAGKKELHSNFCVEFRIRCFCALRNPPSPVEHEPLDGPFIFRLYHHKIQPRSKAIQLQTTITLAHGQGC